MSLQTQLASLATALGGDVKALFSRVGTLTSLTTTAKTDLVSAINEVNAKPSGTGGAAIADGGTSSGSVWSSSKTNQAIIDARAAVKAEILGSGVPAALDTLDELAAALADDAAFAATMTTALGNRVRVDTAAQGLTSTQKSNALTNIGAVAATAVGDTEADLVALYTAAKA